MLYNTVPIVKQIVLSASKFIKQVDLMLRVLTTEGKINSKTKTKENKKLLDTLDMS